MVSRMLQQGQVYFCLNCHMRVFDLNKPNCAFCGSQFSNWADIQIEEFKKKEAQKVEDKAYESNISRKN